MWTWFFIEKKGSMRSFCHSHYVKLGRRCSDRKWWCGADSFVLFSAEENNGALKKTGWLREKANSTGHIGESSWKRNMNTSYLLLARKAVLRNTNSRLEREMVGLVWLCVLFFTKQVTRKIIRWECDTTLGRKSRKEAGDLSCLGQQEHVMWICYGWTVELCNSVEKRKIKQQCETQEKFHTDQTRYKERKEENNGDR